MESDSHRRSGSSGHSTSRRSVHVGTGSWSRKATAEPRAPAEHPAARGAASSRGSKTPKQKANGAARSGRSPDHTQSAGGVAQVKREERERRQSTRRRASRRRLIATLTAVLVVVAAATALYRSQVFEITDVEVLDASTLTEAAVLGRAAVPSGSTLLRFPRHAIEERLLQDPWIASAVISRDFPSTLRIRIAERVPAALVDTGQTFWIVDSSGLVMAEASLDTSSPLVAIRDVSGFEPRPGRTSNSDALVNALRVLDGISGGLKSIVRAVSAPSVDETTLITESSVEIMIGEAVNLPEKSALALGILEEQGSGVVFIDVRSIERPVSRGLDD